MDMYDYTLNRKCMRVITKFSTLKVKRTHLECVIVTPQKHHRKFFEKLT